MPSVLNIIDLSMYIEEGMQCFDANWHPRVEVVQLGRHGVENRETRKLILGTHTGTHVDAPRHFIPDGETIDNVPLEQIVGRASVLDFSDMADRQEVGPFDIERVLGERSAERLILRYDWDLRALNSDRYYVDHPYLSEEACRWIASKGCRLVAMDTPQPDDPRNGSGSEKDAPCHKIFLDSNIILVEYLVNIRAITSPVVELVVAPLKIRGGDGAPARCFAIERGPGG